MISGRRLLPGHPLTHQPVHQRQLRVWCKAQPKNAVANRSPSSASQPELVEPAEDVTSGPASSGGNLFGDVLASSQSFVSQLLSHFSRWPGTQTPEQAEKVRCLDPCRCDAPHQHVLPMLQMLLEASEMERVKQLSSGSVDLKPYLSPVGVYEAKYLRRLSHLSAITYRPDKVHVSEKPLLIALGAWGERPDHAGLCMRCRMSCMLIHASQSTPFLL